MTKKLIGYLLFILLVKWFMEKSSGKVSGSNLGIVIYYLRKRKKMPFTFSKNGAEKVNKI